MGLQIAVTLGCVAAAAALLVKHADDSRAADQYRAAQACTGIGRLLADANCYDMDFATVVDKSSDVSRSGRHYTLALDVTTLGGVSETLACSCADLYDAVQQGSMVNVKIWRDHVTDISYRDLRARTTDNPTFRSADDLRAAILLALAAGYLMISVAARAFLARRSPAQVPAPQPQDADWEPAPGAVGVPAGLRTARGGVQSFRLYPRGLVTPISVALRSAMLAAGGGVAIAPGLAGAVVGGLSGFVLVGVLVGLMRNDRIDVGPDGVHIDSRFRKLDIPWEHVVGAGRDRRAGYVLLVRSGDRVRRVGLLGYVRRPGNATLPRVIETYWRRAVNASPEASMPSPAGLPAQRVAVTHSASLQRRLAAWLVDVLVACLLATALAVLVTLPFVLAHHEAIGGAVGVAVGCALAVSAYPIVAWRIGCTVGMRALGLRVVALSDMSPLSWRRACLRFVAALPSIVCVIPLGLLASPSALDDRAWHDRLAGTVVVRDRGDAARRTPHLA